MASEDQLTQHQVGDAIATPALLKQAVESNLKARTTHRGDVTMHCTPASIDFYMQQLDELFKTLGKQLSEKELAQLQELIAQTMQQGFESSASANVVLRYEISMSASLQKNLVCNVALTTPSLAEQYKGWVETKQPPLFGSQPDAKLMAVVKSIPNPAATAPILDIGAGTGRNTLPLARLGYPVDAIELTPEFASQLQTAASVEKLPVTVAVADILNPLIQMRSGYYKLAIASEVVSHFRSADQLRLLLSKMCDALSKDGLFLFNIFLAVDEYEPDALARQMAEVAWSSLFTRKELTDAIAGLPLEVISDESAIAYEQANLPAEAWPPTGWFLAWATGKSVFPLAQGKSPMELRWILCKRL